MRSNQSGQVKKKCHKHNYFCFLSNIHEGYLRDRDNRMKSAERLNERKKKKSKKKECRCRRKNRFKNNFYQFCLFQ